VPRSRLRLPRRIAASATVLDEAEAKLKSPAVNTIIFPFPSLCIMRFLRGILLPALLLVIGSTSAKKDKPGVTVTKFDDQVANIFYFDDSEVVLLTEPAHGKIWRSESAGQDWEYVKDIPLNQVLVVLKNPYDNNVAVALGAEFTHWITHDKGKTWTEFKTDGIIARGSSPIGFHATDSKKLIYSGGDNCREYPCLGKVSI
jgi:hypothetical protein